MVTIEEEINTLEYQETVNLDIENIDSSSQNIWISIYEVIDDTYFFNEIISNIIFRPL